MTITFQDSEIEIGYDTTSMVKSAENDFVYDFVYLDEETNDYQSSKHSIKVFQRGQLIRSAILCAVGGSTTIHDNSVVIVDDNLYVACANKVFSLSLPDLKLRWKTEVDPATCFGIYNTNNALFTHGELFVTRLASDGQIIWRTGLRDIILTIDSYKDSFIMHDDYIELEDFCRNSYKLDFNGKFIEETLSDAQIRYDQIDKRRHRKWWKFW